MNRLAAEMTPEQIIITCRAIAKRIAPYPVREELASVGILAAVKAMGTHDPAKGELGPHIRYRAEKAMLGHLRSHANKWKRFNAYAEAHGEKYHRDDHDTADVLDYIRRNIGGICGDSAPYAAAYFFGGKKMREIAAAAGVSVPRISQRCSECAELLREKLNPGAPWCG